MSGTLPASRRGAAKPDKRQRIEDTDVVRIARVFRTPMTAGNNLKY